MADGPREGVAAVAAVAVEVALDAVGRLLGAVRPREDVVVDVAVAHVDGVKQRLRVGAADRDGDAEFIRIRQAVGIEVVVLAAEHVVHLARRQVKARAVAADGHAVAQLDVVQIIRARHARQRDLVADIRQIVVVELDAEAAAPCRLAAVIVVRQVVALALEVEHLEHEVGRAAALARLHGGRDLEARDVVEREQRLLEVLRLDELARADALDVGEQTAVEERRCIVDVQVADAADDDLDLQRVACDVLRGHIGDSRHIALVAQARRDLRCECLHLLEVHFPAEIRLHLILQDAPHIEFGTDVVDAVDARRELLAILLHRRDLCVDLGLCLLRRDAALRLKLIEDAAGVRHAFDVQGRRIRGGRGRPWQPQQQCQRNAELPHRIASSVSVVSMFAHLLHRFPIPSYRDDIPRLKLRIRILSVSLLL